MRRNPVNPSRDSIRFPWSTRKYPICIFPGSLPRPCSANNTSLCPPSYICHGASEKPLFLPTTDCKRRRTADARLKSFKIRLLESAGHTLCPHLAQRSQSDHCPNSIMVVKVSFPERKMVRPGVRNWSIGPGLEPQMRWF